jgi:hypothetical protein
VDANDADDADISSTDIGPIPSDGDDSTDTDDSSSAANERITDPMNYESDIEPSGPTPYIQSGEADTGSTQPNPHGCSVNQGPEKNFHLVIIVLLLWVLRLHFRGPLYRRSD